MGTCTQLALAMCLPLEPFRVVRLSVREGDAIAAVRRALWYSCEFMHVPERQQVIEIPAILLQRLIETLCYATQRC